MVGLRQLSGTATALLLVAAAAGCGTRVHTEASGRTPIATTAQGASSGTGSTAGGTSAESPPAAAPGGSTPLANGPSAATAARGADGTGTGASVPGGRVAAGAHSTTGATKPSAGTAGGTGGTAAAGGAARPAAGGTSGSPGPSGGNPGTGAAGCPAPCAPLVIGSVGTWSGLVGQNVIGGLNALQAWVAAANAAGGLGGHTVRLVVADDNTDPARHRSLVQELVERRGVVAFVYNAAVFSGHASVGYLEQKRIPVVGGSGTEPWYTTSPMFFTQIIAGEVAIEATVASYARSAKAMSLTKMGLITCSDGVQVCDDTARTAPGYIKRYGLDLAYQGKASLAQPDFTANCLAARNAGAEILYLALDANSYTRFGKGCASVGYHPRYGIPQPVMLGDLAKDPNLQGSPGVSYTAPFFFAANPAIGRFQQAMAQYAAKAPLTGSASLGWSAAELLGAAVRRLSPTPTSADILEGVWSLNGDDLGGLTAPLRFKRGGPTVPPVCYWQVIVADNSYRSPDNAQRHCEPS
jgi:branched-chain amino acid transport system substrate-binding protein